MSWTKLNPSLDTHLFWPGLGLCYWFRQTGDPKLVLFPGTLKGTHALLENGLEVAFVDAPL